jgi:hypothetical protein
VTVWRPRTLGKVIAERGLKLERPRRRATVVRVRFGCPVRAPRPERGDPWWCPVQISGLGKRRLEKVAGEDSLQALILALEFISRTLPAEADRVGAHLQWLGERENLVFANTFMSVMLERNLENCITGLADAVGLLENGEGGRAAKPLARRLRALIASGGHTGDPRQIAPSNRPLGRPGMNPPRPSKRASAGRSTPLR